jgi:hypothetical protein
MKVVKLEFDRILRSIIAHLRLINPSHKTRLRFINGQVKLNGGKGTLWN